MFPYIPCTPEDEKYMLDCLGLTSVEELFTDIPEQIRLKKLDLENLNQNWK